ncbi:MAG: adenosine kinase [Bdellovibrionota bacterium]|nr:MAG: adenosine kinase [Bdellovibrionota bacterium]
MGHHKDIQLSGIGSGIVDILVDVTDQELKELSIEKESYGEMSTEARTEILHGLKGRTPVLVSGGSVANSMVTFAQLGGRGAFLCCLGDDRYGLHFAEEMGDFGLTIAAPKLVESATATVVSFVTPDGHRTMRVDWGVARRMCPEWVDTEIIARSQWLFIEGYLVAASPSVAAAALHAAREAKRHGTKVAITCSETWVIEGFRAGLDAILEHCDLLFANAREATCLTQQPDVLKAYAALASRFENVVVTAGPEGAYVWYDNRKSHVKAFPCEPRDLTGAGDAMAGGFLYGITNGYDPETSARGGCKLAHEVIMRVGARLVTGAKEYWEHAAGLHSEA